MTEVTVRFWLWAGVLLVVVNVTPLQARPALGPRRTMAWEPLATLHPSQFGGRIRIKFHEGTRPTIQDGRIQDGARVMWDPAVDAPSGMRVTALMPTVGVALGVLDKLRRAAAARCGACVLASMETYVDVVVDLDPRALGPVLAVLNAHKDVEVAYPVSGLVRRPADISPVTPVFTEGQTYLGPAPDGLGATAVGGLPGGNGAGINVVDMEVDWTDDHEDIPQCAGAQVLDVGTIPAGLPYQDYAAHGTAVLSIVLAGNNGYGVTGFAPAAGCGYAPEYTDERGTDSAHALLQSLASGVLREGDVFLMESQTPGPRFDPNTYAGLIPTEWEPAVFDAIRTLVASGVVVVEAAGNGYENLDDAIYNNIFDRDRSDSGAIVVGAGAPPNYAQAARTRLDFSNVGSRVDVQGWGDAVVSAGYGDLFQVNGDERQFYSAAFAGTSSASPMVTGSVALVQAIQKAGGGEVLTSVEMRTLLASTGTPQPAGDAVAAPIGPQPNIEAAVAGLTVCANGRLDRLEMCDDGNTVAGDGCAADCASNESCGNGVTDTAVGEVCDDGNTQHGDGCAAGCRSNEACGNGVLDTTVGEECDDGNTANWDGCNAVCQSFPPVALGCSGARPDGALVVLLGVWMGLARRRRACSARRGPIGN